MRALSEYDARQMVELMTLVCAGVEALDLPFMEGGLRANSARLSAHCDNLREILEEAHARRIQTRAVVGLEIVG